MPMTQAVVLGDKSRWFGILTNGRWTWDCVWGGAEPRPLDQPRPRRFDGAELSKEDTAAIEAEVQRVETGGQVS